MAVPFSDEASLRWILIAFEFFIGLALVYNSKNQPFPRPSARFGWLVLMLATLVLIGQAAPKPMTIFAHFCKMLQGPGNTVARVVRGGGQRPQLDLKTNRNQHFEVRGLDVLFWASRGCPRTSRITNHDSPSLMACIGRFSPALS